MELDLVLARVHTSEGAILTVVSFLVCYGTYSFIRWSMRSRAKRRQARETAYTIGFRRVNGTAWTKVPSPRTDPQRHYEWAQTTSRRQGVAEAWVSYRTPQGDTTRWYWINGKEDRTESA